MTTRPHLWIDPSAGIAGDMLLGALVDMGAPLEGVQDAVDAVLPGTVRLSARQVHRAGMRATKVTVEVLVGDQPSRHWSQIRERILNAGLAPVVQDRAIAVFSRLAEAEAHVHGTSVEHVHFHEVGAWDSIADVVGVCAALDWFDVSGISGGPAGLGGGVVTTSHGQMPVPAPAVLELSRNWQVSAGGSGRKPPGELATPTGVALLTCLADCCEPLPLLVVRSVGVGAGTKNFEGHANVLRVVLGDREDPDREDGSPGEDASPMAVLEANVDDLDPRVWPSVLQELMHGGAADAWLTPILMKKGRPAHTLSVLTDQAALGRLRAAMFRLTSTIGIRESEVMRTALRREWVDVLVEGQPVRIKVAFHGQHMLQATPEFEDVAACAKTTGLPMRQVLLAANHAAATAGLLPGGGGQ